MLSNQQRKSVASAPDTFIAKNPGQIDADFENLCRWIGNRLTGSNASELKWRILLAEDDAANRHVLTRLLERSGLTVTAVENGRQAVEAVADTDFDMVLLDINMPEMDGLEATRTIRAMPPEQANVPIVAVTSEVTESTLADMRRAGFNGCLEKPVRRDALFDTILGILSRRVIADAVNG